MELTNQDLNIIKTSFNWATQSISKLRLIFDKIFGEDLKSILIKTVQINSQLKDILDNFVSGSVLDTENSKTVNDYNAILAFVTCGNNFNNIYNQITSIVLPKLNKLGIEILPTDLDEDSEVKEKEVNKTTNKEMIISKLKSLIEDLYNVIFLETDDENDEALDQRANIIKVLETNIDIIQDSSLEDEINKLYKDSINMYNSYLSKYKSNIASLASTIYSKIIKSASSIEEASSYYLISTADYSRITTPLKEKLLVIKNLLGYSGDKTIYYLRLDCIKYTKVLIDKSDLLVSEIEDAIKINNQKDKWIKIIKEFNEFGYEYNKYRKSYIELFSTIKIKANQDKLQRKIKKDKSNTSNLYLKDFVEHSWVNIPSKADNKFPTALIIMQ